MDFIEFKTKYEKVPVVAIGRTDDVEPLVSVAVMTYQHAGFIEACLESILAQRTRFAVEILLGEDGSTDGTRDICQRYAQQYPGKIRLLLHHRENNIHIGGHPTGRFNFLYNLYAARGKYIALCEGDDYWTDPDKLQYQVDFLDQHPDYALCFHAAEVIEQGKVIGKTPVALAKDTLTTNDFMQGWMPRTASLLFKNADIRDLPTWMAQVASGDIGLLHILSEKGKIKYLDRLMSVYRKHPGGISNLHTGVRKVKDMRDLYARLDDYFRHRYHREYRKATAWQVRHYLEVYQAELGLYRKIWAIWYARWLEAPLPLKDRIIYWINLTLPRLYRAYGKMKSAFR